MKPSQADSSTLVWPPDEAAERVEEAGASAAASPFEREATALGAFRREWSLKQARAVAAGFEAATKGYRRHLDAFAVAGQANK